MKITSKTHAIAFARWILKHADTSIDDDGMFCYEYGGSLIDTVDLYEAFKSDLFEHDLTI